MKADLTILTATIGRPNLNRLIESIDSQTWCGKFLHILLWDDYRLENSLTPEHFNSEKRYNIITRSGGKNPGASPAGRVYGLGIMSAYTPWITMADDDVWWEPNHLEQLFIALENKKWASTLRTVWSPTNLNCIGVDRFESVGDDPTKRVDYEMCDSNTMIFKRELGVYASPAFRETLQYDGDRLLYSFFKQHGGQRGRTGTPTINQYCPNHLERFFWNNCDKTTDFHVI